MTYTLPFIEHTLFILMGNSMHAILYEKRIFLLFISNVQINLFSYMISTEFNIWFAVQNLVILNLKNRRALQSGFSNGPINYQRTLLIAMTWQKPQWANHLTSLSAVYHLHNPSETTRVCLKLRRFSIFFFSFFFFSFFFGLNFKWLTTSHL